MQAPEDAGDEPVDDRADGTPGTERSGTGAALTIVAVAFDPSNLEVPSVHGRRGQPGHRRPHRDR